MLKFSLQKELLNRSIKETVSPSTLKEMIIVKNIKSYGNRKEEERGMGEGDERTRE
jgi:hypothetical protein